MEILYLDPIGKNVDTDVWAYEKVGADLQLQDQIKGDSAKAMEMFSSIAAKRISKEERHAMTQ
jgi:hypothetical protein